MLQGIERIDWLYICIFGSMQVRSSKWAIFKKVVSMKWFWREKKEEKHLIRKLYTVPENPHVSIEEVPFLPVNGLHCQHPAHILGAWAGHVCIWRMHRSSTREIYVPYICNPWDIFSPHQSLKFQTQLSPACERKDHLALVLGYK